MRLEQLTLSELHIPFKSTFRHASAERSETATIWVETHAAGHVGYGESCPRPYVTGETNESARAFFANHVDSLRRDVADLDSLRVWMTRFAEDINRNPAAWCAVELALLDLLGKLTGQTVESLLSLPALAGPFRYSAVLGDSSDAAFAATAQTYHRMGFTDFKLKLSGDFERDARKLAVLDAMDEPERDDVDTQLGVVHGGKRLGNLGCVHAVCLRSAIARLPPRPRTGIYIEPSTPPSIAAETASSSPPRWKSARVPVSAPAMSVQVAATWTASIVLAAASL